MFNKPVIEKLYTMVGEATTLWNQVEGLWYLIFSILMHEAHREKVDAIYDMFQTGAMQRQLIMRVAPIELRFDAAELKARNPDHHLRRRLLKRIGQLNAVTNELAGRRNAVIHTAFEDWGSIVAAQSPHKASKLRDENHVRYLTHLIEDTTLLGIDLADLRDSMMDWLDPGRRENRNEFFRQQGCLPQEDARKVEREQLLKVVAQRKQPPPQSYRG